MQQRRLGRTEIEITPIGLGAMQFSGGRGMFRMMMSHLSQDEVNAITKAALDGGINWFDTAEMYGRGHSERGLANALHAAGKKDSEVKVATKWSPIFRTAKNIPRTIDDRIRSLNGYTIDLYMVHQPWGFSSPEAEMDAMADLVEMGKIRSVGVSNFDAERMRRAHAALQKRGVPLAVNQVQYNLLDRQIETNGVLEAAKELGITIVAWSPLASGLLTAKFHNTPDRLDQTPYGRRMLLRRRIEHNRPLVKALEEIAAHHGAAPAQVALNWLVNYQGDTVVAIPGASKVHHAEQNAGALNFRLSGEVMAQLDDLSRANHA
jgi:aryl-alcohol dehydrogenase-like predicted oxidoreductase